ncbi:YafY family protein [Nocardioides sp.]|uniref:helix-turn-helix transcriptional regulator n=1 Tax=Nocardioides sp. TaxID=35761 RepID=UPI00271B09DF|nr:YafY family protein [Nocardioides sp.]MDO9458180.1 YafY family protein [Nocardioides sp.]
MNRTDRLYALVEELRAVAPRPRSATWLAARFEVSARTIERDLDALREAGVPIWAEAGRTGGYTLDRERTLPPLALTADEALAISVALRSVAGSPFGSAARTAAQKVFATLPADVRRTEEQLAARLHRVTEPAPAAPWADDVVAAVGSRRVLSLSYVDAAGAQTRRDVEPLGLLHTTDGWLLLAWCRLRDGVRGFFLDRVSDVVVQREVVTVRDLELGDELDRIDARPFLD